MIYILMLSLLISACADKEVSLIDLHMIGYVNPKNSKEIKDSYWGIQAGALDKEILQKAADLGVKWTRLQAVWPAIEKEKGVYDWSKTDEAFPASLEFGITPFVSITNGNGLYTPVVPLENRKLAEIYGERPAPPTYNKEAMAAWLNFVRSLVIRYKEKIKYWEIWNEPNHFAFWALPPNAEDYGRLLLESARVIKETDPDAIVIGGSTAGMDAEYVEGYLKGGAAELIDIITYHQYEGEPEERFIKMLDMRQVIDKYNSKIVTWQGECGFPSASSTTGFHGTAPWGENIQAKWLLRQAFSDVLLCGSQLSNYFKLHHSGKRDTVQPRNFLTIVDSTLGYYRAGTSRVRSAGINEKCILKNPSNEPKAAYYAYQNLCAVIDKSYSPVKIKSELKIISAGIFHGIGLYEDAYPSVPIVGGFEKSNGSNLIVYWLPWHGQEYLPELAMIDLALENRKFNNPVLIDLLSGKVYDLEMETSESSQVSFQDIPLADYPFLIVERSEIEVSKEDPKEAVKDK